MKIGTVNMRNCVIPIYRSKMDAKPKKMLKLLHIGA